MTTQRKYSLRKFKVGVASVLVGIGVATTGAAVAHAAETTEQPAATQPADGSANTTQPVASQPVDIFIYIIYPRICSKLLVLLTFHSRIFP